MRRTWGFTLIEMLVVVALMGIFVAIAAPSFAGLIRSNRVQAAADELVGVLQYARGEAVTRGVTVTLTATDANAWNAGFTLTAAGQPQPQLLRRIDASGLQSGVTVSSGAAQASFSATGTSGTTTNQCFTICSADQSGQCRFVGLSVTGRITPPSTTRPQTGECS